MADVSSLYRLVRPYVRNCPEIVMGEWIVESARQFCQDTRWLREDVILDTIADASRYQLGNAAAEEEIIGVFAVQHDERPLDPIGPQEIKARSGRPVAFWYELPDVVVIMPTPYAAGTRNLLVEIITRPAVGAITLSDRLVRRWERAIAQGAVGLLCGMTKAGWFDPVAADGASREYSSEMRKARSEADRNQRHFNFDTAGGIL